MTNPELYSRALDCLAAAESAAFNLESEDPAAAARAEAERLSELFGDRNEPCLSRRFQELAKKLAFYLVDLRQWKERNARSGGVGDPLKCRSGDVIPDNPITAGQMSSFIRADCQTLRGKLTQWQEGG